MARVSVSHLPTIRERVATINRRAEKLGVDGVDLRVGETEQVTIPCTCGTCEVAPGWHDPRVDFVAEVEVIGGEVKLDGWVFLASIDHFEGLVRTSPAQGEVEGLRAYAEEAVCEHCGHNRDRRSTFILAREEDLTERIQVGSTCIKDFLGHTVSLWVWEQVEKLTEEFESFGGGPLAWALEHFLGATVNVIGAHGWVSRSKAQWGDEATADRVVTFLTHLREDVREHQVAGSSYTEEQVADLVARAIAWVEETPETNDYIGNLKQIAANGFVTVKSAGFAASIISSFLREEEKRVAREAEVAVSSPVPATNERITITGTVTKTDVKENAYGIRRVFTVLDDRGFRIWSTAPAAIDHAEVGDRVSFVARVERSDRDETFGFASRPSKARFVEEVVATA